MRHADIDQVLTRDLVLEECTRPTPERLEEQEKVKREIVVVGNMGSLSMAASLRALADNIEDFVTTDPDNSFSEYNIDIKTMGYNSPYAYPHKPKDRTVKKNRAKSRDLQREINKSNGYGQRITKKNRG